MVTPKVVYLPISKLLHSISAVANLLPYNNIWIYCYMQVNSLLLKLNVPSKWASKQLCLWGGGGYHLFCCWWYITQKDKILNYVTVVWKKRNTVSSLLWIMIFADYFGCDIYAHILFEYVEFSWLWIRLTFYTLRLF